MKPTAEVVIIGAGIMGCAIAHALAERGVTDVVVLERDYAGFGASGRNAGHLTPTIGKDLPTLLRLYGRDRGGALVRFAEAAVEHVEAAIAERWIDCDYVGAGNVLAGIHHQAHEHCFISRSVNFPVRHEPVPHRVAVTR